LTLDFMDFNHYATSVDPQCTTKFEREIEQSMAELLRFQDLT